MNDTTTNSVEIERLFTTALEHLETVQRVNHESLGPNEKNQWSKEVRACISLCAELEHLVRHARLDEQKQNEEYPVRITEKGEEVWFESQQKWVPKSEGSYD